MSQIDHYAWNWNYQKYICSGLFNNIQVILKAYCNVFITIMITIINFQLQQKWFSQLQGWFCAYKSHLHIGLYKLVLIQKFIKQ